MSTEQISALPSIEDIYSLSQSIALLDAVLQPVWDLRYFSFNSKWDANESMASMRDSSGEAYFMVFKKEGAILLAQTPHSEVGAEVARRGHPLPGTFYSIPEQLMDILVEPAFFVEDTTFCLWRLTGDPFWQVGGEVSNTKNSSAEVLFALDGNPDTYKQWGDEYFEQDLPLHAIQQVYNHEDITLDLVQSLNRDMTLENLAEDLEEIGYASVSN